jgi:hypothetical protein
VVALGAPLAAGLAAYLLVVLVLEPGLPGYAFDQLKRMVGRATVPAAA